LLLFCCLGAWIGIRASEKYKLNVKAARFPMPEWVAPEVEAEVKASLEGADLHVMQRDVADQIASRLMTCPWVSSVNNIHRSLSEGLNLTVNMRRPVALVQHGGRLHMVDAEGVRLPAEKFSFPGNEPGPVIRYRERLALPKPGEKWEADGVDAGIRLVIFLQKRNAVKALNIAYVDTSKLGTRRNSRASCVSVYTQDGTEIRWGCSTVCSERPYLCNPADELSDEEKFANLVRVLNENPRLEGIEYVDLRWKDVGLVRTAAKD